MKTTVKARIEEHVFWAQADLVLVYQVLSTKLASDCS